MMNREDALEKISTGAEHDLVLALAALGKVGTVDDLQYIVPLIAKSSFEIKHIAAGVASSIIRINLLERYDEQSEELRNKLGTLLSRLAPDLVQEIGRDISREHGVRRTNAIRLLRHLECTPAVKKMLTELLNSTDKNIRSTALEVIDSFKGGVDHKLLMHWIHANDERMRANAVEVIEHLQDSSLISLLFQMKNDPNNRIRANVLKALHALTDIDITNDLIEMLDSGKIRMQASALWVISNMEQVDKELFRRTCKLLRHHDVSIADNAIHALRKMDTVYSRAVLREAGIFVDY